MDTQTVWVRDDGEGYIKGRISEIGSANEFEVQPLQSNEPKRICSVDDIFPACDGEQDHNDNCKWNMLWGRLTDQRHRNSDQRKRI